MSDQHTSGPKKLLEDKVDTNTTTQPAKDTANLDAAIKEIKDHTSRKQGKPRQSRASSRDSSHSTTRGPRLRKYPTLHDLPQNLSPSYPNRDTSSNKIEVNTTREAYSKCDGGKKVKHVVKGTAGKKKVSPLKLKLSSAVAKARPLISPSSSRKRDSSKTHSPVRDVASDAPVLGSPNTRKITKNRASKRSRSSPIRDSASSRSRPPSSVYARDNYDSPVRHSSSDGNPIYESSDREGSMVNTEYSSDAPISVVERQSPDPPLNVHVALTDGYDSDLLTQNPTSLPPVSKKAKIDFKKVTHLEQHNKPGDDIDPALATILQSNWRSASGKSEDPSIRVALDELYKKYQIPANCPFLHPPQTNKEIRKLLKATQRSADVKNASMQKSLDKTMSGIVQLLEEAQRDHPDFVKMGQITADMGAILGDVSHELNKKRRSYVRGSLKYDYKDLCNNRESASFLFGDNLSQDIVDLSASKRLKYQAYDSSKGTKSSPSKNDYRQTSRSYKKSSGSYTSTARKSFLGEGKRSVNRLYRKNGVGKKKK